MAKVVFSYNKLFAKTRAFVARYNVPRHWSKTRNEKFDVHTICVLYVLFEVENKDYRMFSAWLAIAPALGLPDVPHWTTLQKAFKRLPPRLLRKLAQISGRCRDRVIAIDPTYFQLSNPSKGYCKRINRDPRRDKLRKATIVTTTNKKKIADVFVRANERHGMRDIPHIAKSGCFLNRTTLGDMEFDAEKFHVLVKESGGKRSIVPPRYKEVPIWRTKGVHRKALKKKIPKIYGQRSASESCNSAIKRKFGPVLRGKSFWQQARDLYAKCLAYNLMRDILRLLEKLSTEPYFRALPHK